MFGLQLVAKFWDVMEILGYAAQLEKSMSTESMSLKAILGFQTTSA